MKVTSRLTLLITFSVLGCSTSLQITGRRLEPAFNPRTVYLVNHTESRGVEASIQSDLFRRGYVVTTGAESAEPKPVDLIVRYTESWSWDLSFYLTSASILFYDGRSGALIGVGDWKNPGSFHAYPNVDLVVNDIISGILERLGLRRPPVDGQ